MTSRNLSRLATGLAGSLALATVPSTAAAQTVRGVVGDAAQQPVPGVVVTLVDSADAVVARGLTNERGAYRLTAPRAGTYRVRTLRIGFRPVVSAAFALGAGEERAEPLAVARVALALDTLRVADRASCRLDAADAADAAATFAVWEQVRTALTAAQLTAGERAIRATTLEYERALDPTVRRVEQQTLRSRTEYVTQPWRTIAPEVLHRDGYVTDDAAGYTTYAAPGLDMLVAPAFVGDHCFRLTTSAPTGAVSNGSSGSLVGVAFEPTAERSRVPEIRGTLWVDRATSELRRLEYRYTNLPPAQAEHAGGEMTFVRLPTGGWVVGAWSIRMPSLVADAPTGGAMRRIGRATVRMAERPATPRVAAVMVTGGALVVAMRGGDTLYAQPALAVRGAVVDSVGGAPVAGARLTLAGTELTAAADASGRFTFPGVLPGVYTLEARTPSLDAFGAVHQQSVTVADTTTLLGGVVDRGAAAVRLAPLVTVRVPTGAQITATLCRTAGAGGADGIVFGTVAMRGDSVPRGRVSVTAEWTETALRPGEATPAARTPRWIEARADTSGAFRLCGVPRDAAVSLRATSDSGGRAASELRFEPGQRLARLVMTLDPAPVAVGTFVGSVRADSTERPIADVEVSLPELQRRVQTNGDGAFRVADVPAGTHRVLVRRLGYGPLDTRVTFSANRTTQRTIFLSRVRTLDSVVTIAERNELMEDFEANRTIGLGKFLTRAELERLRGKPLVDAFTTWGGVRIVNKLGAPYVMSSRGRGRRLGSIGEEECVALIYLDGVLHSRGPVSIREFAPEQLEAVEYYPGPASIPARYNELKRFGSAATECGVIVLHTRRTP